MICFCFLSPFSRPILQTLTAISLLCMYWHLWSLPIRRVSVFCLILCLTVSALLQVSYRILYGTMSNYTRVVYQPLHLAYLRFVSS